jgi:1,4-alpha-glucan branching enzyme
VTDSGEMEPSGEDAYGPPRVRNGRLLFTYRDDLARRVSVTGEFNGWNPSLGQFARGDDGTWRLDIAAPPPGRYRYKLLVDDTKYIKDPTHAASEPGPLGGYDSVLTID